MLRGDFKVFQKPAKERTPEEMEKIRAAHAKAVEEAKVKNAPYTKATEMGFTLNEEHKRKLLYKGEEVADDIMASWYADDDDYNYYSGCVVYVKGTEVGVRGTLCEVGADSRGHPTGKDEKGAFSMVEMGGAYFKMYHLVKKANQTPEELEKIRVKNAERAEATRLAKEPFTKAKEMGFELKEDTQTNLMYKGEEVAHDIMASWYADDDDYNYYDNCVVYVKGNDVGVRGTLCEVGADRPGLSYRGKYAYIIGTLDGDKFVKNAQEDRDVSMA